VITIRSERKGDLIPCYPRGYRASSDFRWKTAYHWKGLGFAITCHFLREHRREFGTDFAFIVMRTSARWDGGSRH